MGLNDEAVETRVKWLTQFDRVGSYTWQGFTGIRTQRMTNTVFGLAGLRARAERIQDYVEFFGKPDAARDELRHMQAIRSADTATVAEELLLDRSKVVVVVKPTKGAPASGRRL